MSLCIMPYAVDLAALDPERGFADWYAVEQQCRAVGRALPNDQFAGFKLDWLDELPGVHELMYAGPPEALAAVLPRPDDFPLVACVPRARLAQVRETLRVTERMTDKQLADEVNILLAQEAPPLQVIKRVKQVRGGTLSEARAFVKQVHQSGSEWMYLRMAKKRARRGAADRAALEVAYAQARGWIDAAAEGGVDLLLFMY